MAGCPNPVPLPPGHTTQTDPFSHTTVKLGVAKQPMGQTDMGHRQVQPLEPLTHPSRSFPFHKLAQADVHGKLGSHGLKVAEL